VFLKTRVGSCYIQSTRVSVQYIHHLQHIISPTCYRSYSAPHTSMNLSKPEENQEGV